MPRTYVSIGSNIERGRNVRAAIVALRQRFSPVEVSDVYESESVGFSGQPFYNLIAGFDTELTVSSLVDSLKAIEAQRGRVRGPDPFVDRTLDLDVVLYGDFVSTDRNLDVPAQDILNYAFVLRPLAELAPELIHPVCGVSMLTLWSEFDAASQPIEKVELT